MVRKKLFRAIYGIQGIQATFQLLGIFLQGQVASLSPNTAAAGIDPWAPYFETENQSIVLRQSNSLKEFKNSSSKLDTI